MNSGWLRLELSSLWPEIGFQDHLVNPCGLARQPHRLLRVPRLQHPPQVHQEWPPRRDHLQLVQPPSQVHPQRALEHQTGHPQQGPSHPQALLLRLERRPPQVHQ